MSQKMQLFVNVEREMPPKRSAEERRADFGEIYQELDARAGQAQASRCAQCGVPYCQVGCPLHNNIPDWLMLNAAGRHREAYELSAATNPMPEVCGRICPQDRLCEGRCVIEQASFGTVTIGAVERQITERAWEQGWVRPISAEVQREQSVGIIGSGPAGLAAAEALCSAGYRVTIYERSDRAGGLLIYGIPNFKLEKSVVKRRIERLEQGGVVFKLGVAIGVALSLSELRQAHDAVLIATGVYRARQLSLPGSELPGLVPALDYLIAENKRGLAAQAGAQAGPNTPEGRRLSAAGKHVVVVGGGDTAMDCVRTAIRQGARSVTCLYRRDRDNMPGSAREVAHAEEEGVRFCWLAQPAALLGGEKLKALQAQRMRLALPDALGRRAVRPRDDDFFELPADLVIEALGFSPERLSELFSCPELAHNPDGTLVVDEDLQTKVPGVFAAGDIYRGASLVVWALVDGRRAAAAIHHYLLSSRERRAGGIQ